MELQKRLIEASSDDRTDAAIHWVHPTAQEGQSPPLLATSNQQVIYLGSADLRDSLIYACEAFIGTGGAFPWHIDADPVFEKPSTGAAIRFHVTGAVAPGRAEAAHAQVRTVADQLAAIKAAFGLSVSQLAEVLHVKRPTIYSWFDAENAPSALRSANKERLSILCRLADDWNKRNKTPPGALLTAIVVGEASLLDLLSATTLSDAAVYKAFDALAERMWGRESTRSNLGDQMREKRFAEVPRMRR